MELGTLTAIFDADTRKFDAGMKAVEKQVTKVTHGLGATTTSTNQFTNALGPADAGVTSLNSKLGAMAGISVVAVSAVSSLAVGVFKLAKDTAEYAGHLQDLNDQTGIGVSNLSALKIAFDQSGGSIDSGATALGRYLRSVSDASTGNDKLRQKFLDVGFTVEDLNEAYGDSDRAVEILVKRVGELSNSQDRLSALQKIGVRNGQELNGAIIAMKGNLEAFRKEAERLGLVITPEQAKAADDFDDSLDLLEKQIKGMAFSIAHQYIPEISGAIKDLNSTLANNKSGWADWGNFIKTEIRGIRVAAAGLAAFVAETFSISHLGARVGYAIGTAINKSRELHLADSVSAGISVGGGITRSRGIGGGGGGGGGRGGGGKGGVDEAIKDQKRFNDLILANLKTRLESEEGEIGRSYAHRSIIFQEYFDESNRLEEERYRAVKENLQREETAAREKVEGGRGGLKARIALQEAINASLEEEIRHGERLAEIAKEQREEQDRIASALEKQRDHVVDIIMASLDRREAIDFGHFPTATEALEKLGEPPDISAQSQAILDMRERIRDEMVGLAHDLTSVFSRAIGDGFERGAKQGLKSLALGLLDIVQNIFLRKLAEGLGNILSDIALGGSSGGSWWGKLIGIGIGAVGGGIGGGGGAGSGFSAAKIAARATGGSVLANMPYRVHKDEIIVPTQNGMVLNKGQQSNVNNYYIQLPQTSKGGYSSPSSQRELANKLVAALQGAQT